jgi:hypothetical protein
VTVDVVVAHGEAGHRHHQPAVAGDGHGGPDLHDCVEGDGTAFLARCDVDLGRGDGVDLGVDDRLCVDVRQQVADRLLAQDTGPAQAGFEDPAGDLAGAEPRHPHLGSQATDRGVESPVDLLLVNLDGEPDTVALDGGSGRTHKEGRVYRPWIGAPCRRVRS